MTEQLEAVVKRLENNFLLVQKTGEQDEFILALGEICEELEKMENGLEAVGPILELMERYPGISYGAPGPLAHFMETFYKKGYEELLLISLERNPTETTLFLLHRLINDEENPNRQSYLDLMKRISLSNKYPEKIIDSAKDSLSYF